MPSILMRTYCKVGDEDYFVDSGPKWSLIGRPTKLHYQRDSEKTSSFVRTGQYFYKGISRYRERIRKLIHLSHIFYENGMSAKAFRPLRRLSLIGMTMSFDAFSSLIKHITRLRANPSDKLAFRCRLPHENLGKIPLVIKGEVKVVHNCTLKAWRYVKPVPG